MTWLDLSGSGADGALTLCTPVSRRCGSRARLYPRQPGLKTYSHLTDFKGLPFAIVFIILTISTATNSQKTQYIEIKDTLITLGQYVKV